MLELVTEDYRERTLVPQPALLLYFPQNGLVEIITNSYGMRALAAVADGGAIPNLSVKETAGIVTAYCSADDYEEFCIFAEALKDYVRPYPYASGGVNGGLTWDLGPFIPQEADPKFVFVVNFLEAHEVWVFGAQETVNEAFQQTSKSDFIRHKKQGWYDELVSCFSVGNKSYNHLLHHLGRSGVMVLPFSRSTKPRWAS